MRDVLIVIATHGKSPYLPALLEDLNGCGYDYVVIDSHGHYATAAYKQAYYNTEYSYFLFLHDSMRVKDLSFLEEVDVDRSVYAWLTFPISWDSENQRHYIKQLFPTTDASHGIFGPIFYVSHNILDRIILPPSPLSREEEQGLERGWAYVFHLANIPVKSLEGEFDSVKMDADGYRYFTKFRPKRP